MISGIPKNINFFKKCIKHENGFKNTDITQNKTKDLPFQKYYTHTVKYILIIALPYLQ